MITTSLSENEKKVLLYSANLQVRGGFADEQIRRKAVAEFVVCLQNEPFNMTEKDAKKAIKEVSATTAKQIDRDFRIEEKLDKELLRLLDNKFLTRMECESYITLEPEVQHKIAQCYLLLSAVDVSNCDTDARERLLQERNSIHYDFIRAIDRARKTNEPDERDERLETAFAECENAIRLLQNRVGEYRDAVGRHDTEKAEEIAKDVARDQEAKRVEKKEQKSESESATFVEKTIQPVANKIFKKMSSTSYKRGVRKMSQERRDNDVAILNELIEQAQSLRDLIEAAK